MNRDRLKDMHIFWKVLQIIGFALLMLWLGQLKIQGKEVGHWWVEFAQNTTNNTINSVKSSETYKNLFSKKTIKVSKNDVVLAPLPAAVATIEAPEESPDEINAEEQANLMKILE